MTTSDEAAKLAKDIQKKREDLAALQREIDEEEARRNETKARDLFVAPKPVEPGHRYTAAWGEVSQRIGQRQTILTFYMTTMIAIIGATSLNNDAIRLLYLVGPLSMIVAKLLWMHERQISNLRGYLSALEEFDWKLNLQGFRLPHYHATKCRRGASGEEFRRTHDSVVLSLIGGTTLVCVVIFIYNS
jgi:hypothetical protein